MKNTAKQGDLLGFNVKCTAPNGHTEWHLIRDEDSGEATRLASVVHNTFTPLGWTTVAYPVTA